MRLEIPKKMSANCHVYKLGFRYPVIVEGTDKVQYQVLELLVDHFQEPVSDFYYDIDYIGGKPQPVLYRWWNRPPYNNSRWFIGTKKWGAQSQHYITTSYWAAFRNEKDQIWASMLLNKITEAA